MLRCPDCDGAMAKRSGRYGEFLGCLRWPDCRGRRRIDAGPDVQREIDQPVPELSPRALGALLVAAAVAGDVRTEMDAEQIGEYAVDVADATLAALKARPFRESGK